MIHTQENGKKPRFRPNLDPLGPKKIGIRQSLDIMVSYQHYNVRKN